MHTPRTPLASTNSASDLLLDDDSAATRRGADLSCRCRQWGCGERRPRWAGGWNERAEELGADRAVWRNAEERAYLHRVDDGRRRGVGVTCTRGGPWSRRDCRAGSDAGDG